MGEYRQHSENIDSSSEHAHGLGDKRELAGYPPSELARLIRAVAGPVVNIVSQSDLALAGRVILDEVITLGATGAHLFLAREDERRLELLASRNIPVEIVNRIQHASFDDPLLPARAARTREIERLSALSGEEAAGLITDHQILHATHSAGVISVPLVFRGRIMGVLTATFTHATDLLGEEIDVIRAISEVFATGIENARIRAHELELNSRVAAVREASLAIASSLDVEKVLQSLVEQARLLTHARYGALGIVEGNGERVFRPWVYSGMSRRVARQIGRLPKPDGLLGLVPTTGKSIRLRDLQQHPSFRGFPEHHPHMRSFLGVPVTYHGKPVGNLYLTDKIGADEFSLEDAHTAELLAQHAGIAVEHAQTHEQMASERRWLEGVIDRSPVGILLAEDCDGKRLQLNRKARELMGVGEAAGEGDSLFLGNIKAGDGSALTSAEMPLSRALRGENIHAEEFLAVVGDKETPLLVSAGPIRDATGRVQGAVVVGEDVTELKELESLREDWNSIVAHDLRQPLTVIQSFAEMLYEQTPDPGIKRKVEHILVGAKGLSRMISDLADISSLQAGRLRLEYGVVDVPHLVRTVVERMEAELAGHPLYVEIQGEVRLVHGDAQRLEQVVSNLLSNAAKYGTPGGAIEVCVTGNGKADPDGSEQVQISVSNEGKGIDPSDLPRLFRRFQRTSSAQQSGASGLGLGLYISKGLVEAHGGDIDVESGSGKTLFRFSLPAMKA